MHSSTASVAIRTLSMVGIALIFLVMLFHGMADVIHDIRCAPNPGDTFNPCARLSR